MNFSELYKMQYELDSTIHKNHNVNYENTLTRRIMAFVVELGEFANETRCFKFWSNKKMSERNVVLEEYVDGIHFILSIGLALNIDPNIDYKPVNISNDYTENFLEVYRLTSVLNNDRTFDNYINLFNHFLGLADYIGIDSNEIYQAYLAKNKINYQRQENNY